MSFDIFVACVRDGETATFEREIFEEIMGRGAAETEFPLGAVTYADGGAQIFGGEEEEIDHVMFNRAVGDTFYARMWELADRTGSLIFWPDTERGWAVTRPDVIPHVPENAMIGRPYIVRSGRELEDAIRFDIDPDEPENGEEAP